MILKAMAIGRSWWKELALGLLGLGIAFLPLPAGLTPPTERRIRIEARTFAYSPAVISVNPGDRVTIDLVALDVVHGFSIDGYNLNITADPGQTAHLTFVADHPGVFRFHCSVTCGGLQPFMLGQLQVGQNWFMWRAAALLLLAVVGGISLRQP